jgi:hypothetical protein
MPMRIVGEGMAVPEYEAVPPVAVTDATVAGVVEPRAEEAAPDEVPMAEAMMADEAVTMAHETGMAEAMPAEVAEAAAATEVHAAAAAMAAPSAAATATAMTSAELVDAARHGLHHVHV